MRNPFATSRVQKEFATPENDAALAGQNRYAVPNLNAANPYVNHPAGEWSPVLHSGPESTPDSARLQVEPLRDYRPDGSQPPQVFFGKLDANKAQRSAVENQDADGWEEPKTGFGYPNAALGADRWKRNPRRTPPPETRPTMKLSPRTYSFIRPFMTGQPKMGARSLNGTHFSMASNKRTYQILGMKPPRRPGGGTRNTYRLTPGPWDSEIVDKPPINQQTPLATVPPAVAVPYKSRSWRLP